MLVTCDTDAIAINCSCVVQEVRMSAPAPPSGAGGATLEGVRVRSPRTNRRSFGIKQSPSNNGSDDY